MKIWRAYDHAGVVCESQKLRGNPSGVSGEICPSASTLARYFGITLPGLAVGM